eukprot:scaffold18398_cov63-Phaeocystis_antarctica.AAC.5
MPMSTRLGQAPMGASHGRAVRCALPSAVLHRVHGGIEQRGHVKERRRADPAHNIDGDRRGGGGVVPQVQPDRLAPCGKNERRVEPLEDFAFIPRPRVARRAVTDERVPVVVEPAAAYQLPPGDHRDPRRPEQRLQLVDVERAQQPHKRGVGRGRHERRRERRGRVAEHERCGAAACRRHLRRVTQPRGQRVEALLGQPAAARVKRHEQGLCLGQVLGGQLAHLDLEGGARDVGGADGNLGADSRQAHGRDTVPNADLLAAERVEHDGGRVDLIHARDAERGGDVRDDLVDGLAAADFGRARGVPGEHEADRLHAEEFLQRKHRGDIERQVVRRRGPRAHDLAVGVGHGAVALDVGVLEDRRHEYDQAAVAEEQ